MTSTISIIVFNFRADVLRNKSRAFLSLLKAIDNMRESENEMFRVSLKYYYRYTESTSVGISITNAKLSFAVTALQLCHFGDGDRVNVCNDSSVLTK